MKKESGQSLIELVIAMSIFVVSVSVVSFLILNVYLSDKLGREKTIATFLAQEGMEAVRSIRDNNWDDLPSGYSENGLAIFGNHWVFQGSKEDLSWQLTEGKRKIIIEEIDGSRRKITSQVTWKVSEERENEVRFFTYLTNWSETSLLETCVSYCQSIGYADGTCRKNVGACKLNGETNESSGNIYCTGGLQEDTCCCTP